MKLQLQFFGGRGSAGGNSKESAVAKAQATTAKSASSIHETRRAEDMEQEERAYIHRDISRTLESGDSKDINSSLIQAPLGTVLTHTEVRRYSTRKGAVDTYVKTGQDTWERTFKHAEGFEHLDSNKPEKFSTKSVATRMYEGRKFTGETFDVKYRKLKK